MITFVKNILKPEKQNKKKGQAASKSVDYNGQAETLKSADIKERLYLAGNSQTHKEILYYLAEKDPSPDVRKAVIQNESMPVHASDILARDNDVDVRLTLAARLVDLLPDLSKDKQSQLYAFAVQALGTLALDEVLKIRLALSATLKDHAHTPPKIAGQLARDVEREVSEPILRFCAALTDEDLLDILKSHPADWVIVAVAERPQISAPISEAVIETDSVSGGTHLINNAGASLCENTLHNIVEKARTLPEWQKPIATRAKLPKNIAAALADFVDSSVRDILLARDDFDAATSEEIAAIFRRRLDFADEEKRIDNVEERLKNAIKENRLNEETISDAVAMRDKEFVSAAIAHLIKGNTEDVSKILSMKAPKPIISLTWHAGLSMRLALQLQKEICFIPPKELIYPRNGTDYPLTLEELEWQTDFLGLK